MANKCSYRRRISTGIIVFRIALLAAIALTLSCAPAPKIKREPAPKPTPPPVPAGFALKPFQVSMREEMRKSYERADEIMTGVLTAIRDENPENIIYYFENFSLFNKETFSWGKPMDVIVEVRPGEFRPEIIRRDEMKKLVPLDRVGICWDTYEGTRSIFLVEGQKNLVFLKVGLNEATSESFRNLLDAYPATPECRAVDVFNLMIRHLVEGEKQPR